MTGSIDRGSLRQLFDLRLELGARETPLEPLDRLRRELGRGPRLWIKRDDLMSRALGGNKLRKLEFLLHDARADGATAVGTIGGPTSNHLRITACASTWLGFRPYCFVVGDTSVSQGGNLRLLELLGATVCDASTRGSIREAGERARAEFETRCQSEGLRGFWITFGGASIRGDLGYVLAARELAAQLASLSVQVRPRAIFVAVGTGGTFTGLVAGAAMYLPTVEVVGYAVSPKGAQVFSGLPSVASQITRLSDRLRAEGATISEPRFRFEHGQVGKGYAEPTEAADRAIRLLARTEGIFLDPVYTGKAFAGLLSELEAERFNEDDDVIFVHTGGLPGLFFDRALIGKPR
jgi:1-aminocyclopropane-1-carboxylate deaminase/D-cysteine desulfhydrase-like pyridoxal-dependent ACC family enzyme